METKAIVQMVVDNIQKDVALVEKAKAMVMELIDGFIVSNAEIIVAIEDEKQFFDVIEGISTAMVTDEQLDEMIKLPFYLEPFDGIAIAQFRPTVTKAILGFVNTGVLDKVFGPEWFVYFKKKAEDVVNGYRK